MIRNSLYFAVALMIFISNQGFTQSKSAVQFYDSTGASKTGKIGWSGDATNGHFFLQTPADGEMLKSKTGGVEVSGTMSATRFTGDGSGLTNLPSPTVTVGSVTGLQDSLSRKSDTNWVKTKIANIGTAQIPDGAVTTAKIADKAVTDTKIDSVSWSKLKGIPALFRSHSDSIAWVPGTEGQVWKMGTGGKPVWGSDLQGAGGATTISGISGLSDSLTAHRTLINGKANTSHTHTINNVNGVTDSLTAHRNLINTKANIAGPTFTGDVTVSSGGGLVVNTDNSVDPRRIITLRNGHLINGLDLGITTGTASGVGSGISFKAAGDATITYYDFYAKGSDVRNGDAMLRIHGDGNGDPGFLNRLELTHTGANGWGEISTYAGDLRFYPSSGIVYVEGIVNSTSDSSFKKHIQPIDSAVRKVEKLTGVSYEFRNEDFPERNFPTGKQIGLIAQDVEKVIPEVVNTDKDGYKSLAYDRLVAVLIEAVKEQQVEIELLKKQMTELSSGGKNK
jgi:hypothetical protein